MPFKGNGNGGVTYPSPNEWPVTVHPITGIVRGLRTTVTAPAHGITLSPTASTPVVDFSFVKGMQQINGMFGYVTQVVDVDTVIVDLNSSNYSPYISGGFLNVTGGSSPIDPLTNIA